MAAASSGQRVPNETDEDDLAELMVGRDVQLVADRGESHPGETTLTVDSLHVNDDRGSEVVRGVSFEIRAGEILGIAGVAGNGQDELVEALVGLRKASAGSVRLSGRDILGKSPRDINEAGVAYVPADRHRFGLVLSFPISDNIVLTGYYHKPFARGILRDEDAILAAARDGIKEYDIRTPSETVSAGALSGGNQQKVVVAREYGRDLRCSSSTNRPAASTSAASSSSTAAPSRSAMRGPPSSSSRPSWTRSWNCQIGLQ